MAFICRQLQQIIRRHHVYVSLSSEPRAKHAVCRAIKFQIFLLSNNIILVNCLNSEHRCTIIYYLNLLFIGVHLANFSHILETLCIIKQPFL